MAGVKGQSGRRPKSIAQHKLQGTYLTTRHSGIVNPTPQAGSPTMPGHALGRTGQRAWRRLVKLLRGSELLTVVDGDMLYAYCQLFDAAAELVRSIRRVDLLPRRKLTPTDRLRREELRARLMAQRRAHLQAMRMYLVEFGLSPSSRSRIDLSAAGAGALAERGDEMSEFDRPQELTVIRGGRAEKST